MSDDEGREVILAILGQGEFFGEMGLIDEAPRSATVIAIEPCELLTISKLDFKKCLQENFDICTAVMKGLVKRLREADKKIGSLALMDVYGRVARLLLSLAKEEDGKLVVPEKMTQQDIADRVGASRDMISRIFKDLTIGGYVTIEGYERFDGHTPAPSEMTYATLQCEIFGSVAVGQTLTDESGTVSGLIIAITTP